MAVSYFSSLLSSPYLPSPPREEGEIRSVDGVDKVDSVASVDAVDRHRGADRFYMRCLHSHSVYAVHSVHPNAPLTSLLSTYR